MSARDRGVVNDQPTAAHDRGVESHRRAEFALEKNPENPDQAKINWVATLGDGATLRWR
jgi:hypothetical protein